MRAKDGDVKGNKRGLKLRLASFEEPGVRISGTSFEAPETPPGKRVTDARLFDLRRPAYVTPWERISIADELREMKSTLGQLSTPDTSDAHTPGDITALAKELWSLRTKNRF